MSIVSIVEKAFAGLVALLRHEAAKHRKNASHKEDKAFNHQQRERRAVEKIKVAGAQYRASLYNDVQVHDAHADRAEELANKIEGII